MIYSGPVEVAEPIQSQNQLNGLNQQWFKCFKPRQISSDRFPSFLKKKKKKYNNDRNLKFHDRLVMAICF